MIKVDKFGDSMFAELYGNHSKMSLEPFREYCISLVQNHTVSAKAKKDAFIRSLQTDRNKDRMVKRVSDIMLAGEGLAVGSSY
jgi:hypothetical protein